MGANNTKSKCDSSSNANNLRRSRNSTGRCNSTTTIRNNGANSNAALRCRSGMRTSSMSQYETKRNTSRLGDSKRPSSSSRAQSTRIPREGRAKRASQRSNKAFSRQSKGSSSDHHDTQTEQDSLHSEIITDRTKRKHHVTSSSKLLEDSSSSTLFVSDHGDECQPQTIVPKHAPDKVIESELSTQPVKSMTVSSPIAPSNAARVQPGKVCAREDSRHVNKITTNQQSRSSLSARVDANPSASLRSLTVKPPTPPNRSSQSSPLANKQTSNSQLQEVSKITKGQTKNTATQSPVGNITTTSNNRATLAEGNSPPLRSRSLTRPTQTLAPPSNFKSTRSSSRTYSRDSLTHQSFELRPRTSASTISSSSFNRRLSSTTMPAKRPASSIPDGDLGSMPATRIEYTFYVNDNELNQRPFADRRIEAIGKASQCCICLHKPPPGHPPVFYKGMRVLPVTVSARTMLALKRCLARLDMQYPYFNAKAFCPPDMY